MLRRCGASFGIFCGLLAAALALFSSTPSSASEKPSSNAVVQRYEAWIGADATNTYWTVYGGMTAALYGDIRQDGFKLRTAGGYGEYRYWRPYFDPATSLRRQIAFEGRHHYMDALLGYQATFGPTTVKAFVGLVASSNSVRGQKGSGLAVDEENIDQGDRYGAKVQLETWTRLGEWGFFQFDAGWSEPYDQASARVRVGKLVSQRWSVGLEAGAFGNPLPDQGRAGAFARYAWDAGEASVSVGAGGEWDQFDRPYGAFNLVFRF